MADDPTVTTLTEPPIEQSVETPTPPVENPPPSQPEPEPEKPPEPTQEPVIETPVVPEAPETPEIPNPEPIEPPTPEPEPVPEPQPQPEIKTEPEPQTPQSPQNFTPQSESGVGSQPSEEPKQEPPKTEQPKVEIPQPEQPEPEIIPEVKVEPPPINIDQLVDQKLKANLEEMRSKANEARKTHRDEHLQMIEKLVSEKQEITNQDVRDLAHVSQTTATEYLSGLVKSGKLKSEGKGKATIYKNIF